MERPRYSFNQFSKQVEATWVDRAHDFDGRIQLGSNTASMT